MAIRAVGGSRKLGGLLIVMTGDPDEQVRSRAAMSLAGFASAIGEAPPAS